MRVARAGRGPRSRPELGGGRGGGGVGLGRGGGSALRRPHPGLVQPLSQVLLILSNILLQAIGPGATHTGRREREGRGRGRHQGGGEDRKTRQTDRAQGHKEGGGESIDGR